MKIITTNNMSLLIRNHRITDKGEVFELKEGVCDEGDCEVTVKNKNGSMTLLRFRNRLLHKDRGFAKFVVDADGEILERKYASNGEIVSFFDHVRRRMALGNPMLKFMFDDPETYLLPKSTVGNCVCKRCSTVNEYAESNQDDGSYLCYNCR